MKFVTLIVLFCSTLLTAQNIPLYVGTFTNENSEGIYSYSFNTKTGEISNEKLVAKIENPSFISFSSDKKFMYAVNRDSKNEFANAFSVSNNGDLNLINKVGSNGKGPCHVQLNKSNTKLVVSNYGGGTISLYDINKNGSLNEAFQVLDHNLPEDKSRAHSAKFLKNSLFIADLGRDFLAHYNENKNLFKLKENYKMKDGAGPRHFEISKKGKYIYVINELNATVSVLKKTKKTYTNIQDISTLRADYSGKNSCADIHLSKNEQFLYGSNRGENSIVVFKRNKKDGTLEKIQSISVHGDWPRNFSLSPDGNFMLVANRKSNNISVYNVNKISGKLSFLQSFESKTPVCLLF
ncbi:lactonase family protein [uncultured Lutibacter sp.]|uniref:lactonase family protein n=1 Tax=uncultured Lutibacter sp. TaxID=437739 RepID=UPI0026079890|nr:lactonase family protein [uncultured Lutibacter sp.]